LARKICIEDKLVNHILDFSLTAVIRIPLQNDVYKNVESTSEKLTCKNCDVHHTCKFVATYEPDIRGEEFCNYQPDDCPRLKG